MKIKLVTSTALALAVVLAATGCKHKPVAVTPIPVGHGAPVTDIGGGGTINPYNGGGGINTGGGGVNNAPIPPMAYNPDNFTKDASTLAAYTILFAYDSAVVRDNEQSSLQSVAQQLQSNPSDQLLVEGNCDERGTEEYNRSLGERRALAAREALAKLGIDPSRVHEISYGKDKPADTGHDEAAWSKNRRDDFVLLIPKAGA
jgi:peptidoglycan-associated lipoprotein